MQKLKCAIINFLVLLTVTSTVGLSQSVSLSLASASSNSGGSVVLPLSLVSSSGALTSAVQWSFQYPTDITSVSVALGSSSSAAQKSLTCKGNTCVIEGLNGTSIADGPVATATFKVAANPTSTTYPIQVLGVVAANPTGGSVIASSSPGTITLPTSTAALSALACLPVNLNAGSSAICTISLSSAAPTGGFAVPLSSNNSNLTAPASVNVVAGQTSITFNATAAIVTIDQPAAITAGSGALTKVATLNLIAPVQLTGIVCAPTSLLSNTSSACTLTLNKPAIVAAAVSISSNNTAVTVPATVTIPIGQSTTAFQATAGTVAAGQTATIAAVWSGVTKSAILTLGTTATGVPSVVSVTPNAATGTSQTFSFVFADSQSASNLSGASILFNTSQALLNSCMISYDKTAGTIQLQWDGATGNNKKLIASTATLQNSQCTVGATSVVASGLTTTLAVNVTFTNSFSGLKNIYMSASNGGAVNTGWIAEGTYTVNTTGAPVPSLISASPAEATGTSQVFTLVYGDSQSAANLSGASVLFAAGGLTFQNGCVIIYDKNAGTVQLEWDSFLGSNGRPIASTTVLQNSQCSVGAASVVASGTNTTLTLAISFKSTFSGVKRIYMYASDTGGAVNTGWVQKAAYTVTGAAVPSVISVIPNAGTGASQTFSFAFGDSVNAANLSGAAILIAPSLIFPNSCMVIYDKNAGTVQLEWDNYQGANSKLIASTVVLSNSQCSIGATSMVSSGLTTTLTMSITFKGASGLKNIYMYGADTGGTSNTGWIQAGTFNFGNGVAMPSAISVSPNAGAGASQTFAFVFGDSIAATNLTGAVMLFDANSLPNSCMVIFDRTQGTLQLEWDSVNGSDNKPVGSSAPIQNSQCSIGANSVVTSGLTTTITMDVNFKPTFTGLKNISMFGTDTGGTTNTGWVQEGTWTP